MNRVIIIIISSLIIATSMCWAKDAKRVIDPYVEEKFSCTGEPEGRLYNSKYEKYGYGRFRFLADLNFDGKEDLILTRSALNDGSGCGNGGCDVIIFLKQSDGSYLTHDFGLHPLAVNLKKIKQGEGKLSIYWHMSADDGSLSSYNVSLNSIKSIASTTIHTNDSTKDNKLYESLFGEKSRLKPEFARCKNGNIYWTTSYE